MKKILFICIYFFTLLGCEEIKLHNCEYKHKDVSECRLSTEDYHGFDKKETIKGNVYIHDNYFKLLIHNSKDSTYFVSKHAFSCFRNRCFAHSKIQPANDDKIPRVYVNLRKKEYYELFMKEYEQFSATYFLELKITAYIVIFNTLDVSLLTKKAYDKWMIEHPKTKILNY